jgi:hypothetical protein
MKESELKNKLSRDFNFYEIWKPLFSMLFSKVQYFSSPSNPFAENLKVISGKQTGVVKLDDGKQIAIFEVEVDDTIRIDKNRQGLREIAIKHIDQNITHGAFVFFYSKDQKDYRFSFIARWSELDQETGEFKKGETTPKRYTYLLGANEACTTAAKRLLFLAAKRENQEIGIKDIIDTFSVESLNKEFFKSYKEHYERFWRFIANPDHGFRDILLDNDESKDISRREKPIRDFAKKLLGRIVFLHFLQKKGWMGCDPTSDQWGNGDKQFMQHLFSDFADKARFHSKCLTKLFFNTLNTRRNNDIFEIEGLAGKLNGSRIPYLNGGLFDSDKPEAVLTIDFPEKYFAELLDFFEQYNFTIDENSPDDHEVGIDPEMLGHIFENLLEENREKGAFYTPKEVVQYMCKESLIQYLNNHFDESVNVALFIRNHIVSEKLAKKDHAVLLNDLLNNIKVCDPAIGSGAFPIGMLQEIFDAKKFIYPFLKTNHEFNPAQVKKDIIQHSIYGVDLEKGAVDIAKLRFWLALVVDEENPHPLPNLDYKIMQGNSLLESFEGIDLSKTAMFEEPIPKFLMPSLFEESETVYGFSDENKKDIKRLVIDYYKTEDKEQKTIIRKRIDQIVLSHIDKSLEFYEKRLLEEIAELERRFKDKMERLNDAQKELYQSKSKEQREIEKRKQQLDNRNKARKKLLSFEHTDERPYFLWHLFFMEVFAKGGFDVIIGNPPYIQLQKMGKDADILQEIGFQTFIRTGDIYCLFYEKGFDLLRNSGTLIYITSNKWMRGGYGKALRTYFTKVNTKKILNLGPGIFNSATVDTNIYVGKKEFFLNQVKGISIDNRFNIKVLEDSKLLPLHDLNEDAWVVLEGEELQISKSFENKGKPLRKWDLEINRGVLTGFNEAFIIDQAQRDLLVTEDPKLEKLIKPILKGREIERYYAEWSKDFIIFIPWHFPLHNDESITGASQEAEFCFQKQYPSLYNYFVKNKTGLINRNKAETGIRYEWYALQRCAATYKEEFKKEKVIWKRIGSLMRFAYSDEEMYCLDSTCIATGEKIKYLTAVLNSKAGLYQLIKTSPQTGTGDQIISVQALEPLLVHYPTPEIESKFNVVVDYILFIKKAKENIIEETDSESISGIFEEIIDMMVYELYFEEHMREKEIDVLQFIDFPDISKMQTFEEKRDTIQRIYFWLKEKENPIRNRILVSESRSWIIRRINKSTH